MSQLINSVHATVKLPVPLCSWLNQAAPEGLQLLNGVRFQQLMYLPKHTSCLFQCASFLCTGLTLGADNEHKQVGFYCQQLY